MRMFLAILVALLVHVGAAHGEILLNELMADPASDWDGDSLYQFRDDEWVEVINTGPATESLDGYRLAGPDTTWRYAFTGILAPGEIRVVYGSESYAWEQATGNPQFGFRLSNTGGEIVLWRHTATDSSIVDRYVYADHEAEDDRSTGRFPDGEATWMLFDWQNPYTGSTPPVGSGCGPSPGLPAFCPVPVKPGSWGRIKVAFASGP